MSTKELPIEDKKKKRHRRRHKKKNVKRLKTGDPMEVVDLTVDTKEAIGFSFDLEKKEEKKDVFQLGVERRIAARKKAEDFLNTIKEDVSKRQVTKTNHNSTTKPKPGTVLSPQLHRVICRGTTTKRK